jgi:hypothetical protein
MHALSPPPTHLAPSPLAPRPTHAQQPTQSPLPSIPGIEKRRQATASTGRRSRRRQRNARRSPYERVPDSRHSQEHRELPPERADFGAEELPSSGGGAWLGGSTACAKGERKRLFSLPELEHMGYRVVRWNGRYVYILLPILLELTSINRDPKLILDNHGRIIAILIGTPEDPDWDAVIADAVRELRRARRRCIRRGVWRTSRPLHRRGRYIPLSTGVSLGGGQKVSAATPSSVPRSNIHLQRPGNIYHGPVRARIIQRVRRNPNVRRIMGFQSSTCIFLEYYHLRC